jgi:hypothetical protein
VRAPANHSRLTSLIYPDGFTVDYNYASGLDNVISRLTSMTNSSTTLESLSYLGLGTVVQRAHPQSGVDLTFIGTSSGEAGDKYVGRGMPKSDSINTCSCANPASSSCPVPI